MHRCSVRSNQLICDARTAPGCPFVVPPSRTAQRSTGSPRRPIIGRSAARGATPDEDWRPDSDVSTNGTIFADIANISLALGMKDPGSNQNPSMPTSANYITVTRYHVKYIRSDGRNTQGVDVPYEFDAGSTATVIGGGTEVTITLVRAQAKLEAPLKALVGQGGQIAITTVAEITLYGKDQAGREVSVKGTITVNFADFG